MRNKFIFFDIRRNGIVSILIIIEIALWIFYTASLVSLINFDNSYRKRYNRAISIDNSEIMTFYKMINNDNSDEDHDTYINYIKETLKVIKNSNYTYGFIQRDMNERFPIETFGFTPKELFGNFTEMDELNSPDNPIGFNYGMIENYKKNIIGEIYEDDWTRSDNYIPVIVGNEIGEKVHIGDSYVSNNITYKIIGIFKKDTLAFDYTSSVDSSFLLNTSFVIPLSEEKFFDNFGMNL